MYELNARPGSKGGCTIRKVCALPHQHAPVKDLGSNPSVPISQYMANLLAKLLHALNKSIPIPTPTLRWFYIKLYICYKNLNVITDTNYVLFLSKNISALL